MSDSHKKVISFSSYSPFENNEQLYDKTIANYEHIEIIILSLALNLEKMILIES